MTKREWLSKYYADLSARAALHLSENDKAKLQEFYTQSLAAVDFAHSELDSHFYDASSQIKQDFETLGASSRALGASFGVSADALVNAAGLVSDFAGKSARGVAVGLQTFAGASARYLQECASTLAGFTGDVFAGASSDYLGSGVVALSSDLLGGVVAGVPGGASGGAGASGAWVLAPDNDFDGGVFPLPFPVLSPSTWRHIPAPVPASSGKRHIQPGEVLFCDVFPGSPSPSAYVTFCDGYAVEEHFSTDNGASTGFRLLHSARMPFFNSFAPLPVVNHYLLDGLPVGDLPLAEYFKAGVSTFHAPLFPVFRQFSPAVGFNRYSVYNANFVFYCNEVLQYKWRAFNADGSFRQEWTGCKQFDEFFTNCPLTVLSGDYTGRIIEGKTVIKFPTFSYMILDSFPTETTSIFFPRVPAIVPAFASSRVRGLPKIQNVKSLVV